MTAKSDVIFAGTVIDLQVQYTGSDIRRAGKKTHSAPMQQPQSEIADDDNAPAAALPDTPAGAPVGLGVEGGRMLFTHVTMMVDRAITGDIGSSTISFRVAGGVDGDTAVTVAGMPTFELGKHYLLFLRPDYRATGAPVVGVNQGFFEVKTDVQGFETILNGNGDIVIALENDMVIVRQNPLHATTADDRPDPAPVPDDPGVTGARTSPEVERYYRSTEPPMSLNDFSAKINAIKGEQR